MFTYNRVVQRLAMSSFAFGLTIENVAKQFGGSLYPAQSLPHFSEHLLFLISANVEVRYQEFLAIVLYRTYMSFHYGPIYTILFLVHFVIRLLRIFSFVILVFKNDISVILPIMSIFKSYT